MKHYIIIAAIACAASVSAAEPDSVLTFECPDIVVVTENPSGTSIAISGSNDDGQYNYNFDSNSNNATILSSEGGLSLTRRRHPEFDIVVDGFDFGFVGGHAPSALDLEQGKSFELGILHVLGFRYINSHGNYITFGPGIVWRNRRTTGNTRFTVSDDGTVGYGGYAEGVTPRFSRLKVFSLQFPLIWSQKTPLRLFDTRLAFSVGAIANWNAHGSILTSWTDENGDKVKENITDFGLRRFSVDFYASVRVCSFLRVYARYSPYKIFTGGGSVAMKNFSTGLTLVL